MKAIQIAQNGGPEVLQLADVPIPQPGEGEAMVRQHASGVNFIDIYFRTGVYAAKLPITLGQEGAGVVEKVGPGVTEVKPGDRVAYANVGGTYAEYVAGPAWRMVPIPDGLDFQQAAAAMLGGMTAHYLVHSTYQLKAGDTLLLHAAAGGVGLLLIQMAKRIGARVIGTAGTEDKARLAREAGADEVIVYSKVDFEPEVKRLTNNKGVQVVYDSVGRETFDRSMNCLAPRGMLALFGHASGTVDPVNPLTLLGKGSLFLTRPSLIHYTATREELLWRAGDVLGWVKDNSLKLRIDQVFPLAETADAHRRLEGRQSTGKLMIAI